jgi:NTE family protein
MPRRFLRSRLPGCRLLSLSAALVLILTACWAHAQQQARPRIGLVLAGGGAKGVAHIGVLKVLDEMNVPVHYVVGTSMGSIVAGGYAVGLTGAELERRVRASDLAGLLEDRPPRSERSLRAKELDRANVYGLEVGLGRDGFKLPAGAIVGQNIEIFLGELVGAVSDVGSFDNLPIPYRAVATDILTGEMVLLERGDLVSAMRASMAVPGVFSPVDLGGRLLVDGGLVRNLPVDVARSMGAEVLIVVNLAVTPRKREDVTSAVGITQQMADLLIDSNVNRSLAEVSPRDVVITAQLGSYSSANFREAPSLIPVGEQAARAMADQLRELALPPEEYRAFRAAQLARERQPRPVEEVRVDTASMGVVNPDSARVQVHTGPTEGIERADMADEIQSLMATDDFEQVRYRFADEDGKRVLVLEPVAKRWGPSYLRFGLNLSSDFEGDTAFNLLVDHRATWLNQRGLEWRNSVSLGQVTAIVSELYQPFDLHRRFFVAPRVGWRQQTSDLFVDEDNIARYRDRRVSAGVDLGLELSRTAELRVGYEWGRLYSTRQIGVPVLPDVEEEYGALQARLVVDRLDNWGFPTRGVYLNASIKAAREGLGGDSDFDRAQLDFEVPLRFTQRHRLLAGVRLGDSFGTTLPFGELFPLGGFLNLSGYQPREILSEGFTFGRLVYYYRLGDPGFFTEHLFLGASLEGAQVRDQLNSLDDDDDRYKLGGSLFFAADTALGPLYLGLGIGEDGRYAVYLFLGRP